MTCAACVSRIERTLAGVEGVEACRANLATETITVSFDPARTDAASLGAALDAIGYHTVLQHDGTAALTAASDTGGNKPLIVAVALALTVVTLEMGAMSDAVRTAVGLDHGLARGLAAALTTVLMATAGRPFFRAAWTLARQGTADMHTLIALGTGTAWLYSMVVTLSPAWHGHTFFDTAASILALVLVGRWLERRARRHTTDALRKLATLQPATALLVAENGDRTVPIASVIVGDVLRIRTGDSVAVDGTVVDGSATVDEAMLTGESLPVDKHADAAVYAGTVVMDGTARIRATAVGSATVLASMMDLVQRAQQSKPAIQRMADRIAAVVVPIVLLLAVLTLAGNLLAGVDPVDAIIRAIAVVVVACPCALGLATPTALVAALGAAARRGILVRDADALERAHHVDTIVLDKTGTITEGQPVVVAWRIAPAAEADVVRRYAAAAEGGSGHPLAKAIVASAGSIAPAVVTDSRTVVGCGIVATVDGHTVAIGKPSWIRDGHGWSPWMERQWQDVATAGTTVMAMTVDGVAVAVMALADRVRPSSADAIATLMADGLSVILLSGDGQRAADDVAAAVGITAAYGDRTPADKAAMIEAWQREGRVVAMVGDGINDAAALATADCSIAMGGGSAVATATAAFTVLHDDLHAIRSIITLSRRTTSIVRQNLVWAFLYNAMGLPLAAVGVLDPIVAAAAMAFSSISVVLNALRARQLPG